MEDKNKNKVQPKIKSGRTNDDHTYKRTYSLDMRIVPFYSSILKTLDLLILSGNLLI